MLRQFRAILLIWKNMRSDHLQIRYKVFRYSVIMRTYRSVSRKRDFFIWLIVYSYRFLSSLGCKCEYFGKSFKYFCIMRFSSLLQVMFDGLSTNSETGVTFSNFDFKMLSKVCLYLFDLLPFLYLS